MEAVQQALAWGAAARGGATKWGRGRGTRGEDAGDGEMQRGTTETGLDAHGTFLLSRRLTRNPQVFLTQKSPSGKLPFCMISLLC
jgi:hypothetical protein